MRTVKRHFSISPHALKRCYERMPETNGMRAKDIKHKFLLPMVDKGHVVHYDDSIVIIYGEIMLVFTKQGRALKTVIRKGYYR